MSQDNNSADNAKWYVVHTYSGYENKVKANLEKIVENRGMHDIIQEIVVPMEEQIEFKDGKRNSTLKKLFPSYVLMKMVMDDDSWYIVRNTRGVTGFVGPGSKPVPLSDEEIIAMGVEAYDMVVDLEVGDSIVVLDGPLESFSGIVESVDVERQKATVRVSMFGRETSVEFELTQIMKV